MAAQDSDSEEDFVTFGKPLEQYEEGEKPKKPIPLQEQTVKDEKGRFKRFHGAFTGGFSAGYFNTVGTKEGWAPSTFVSSRQEKSESKASRPEDFMDEEDLGEFGIAPNEIMTTDDFASKTKNKMREKARELAAVTAPIPGATILEDLIAPAKITVGVQLLRQMGWKEGQGVGPRTKRKTRKQETDSGKKFYGCALPPTGSEGSEDEDEYLPENVTFAPKDVIPIDFTMKDNVHGLGYRGLDPRQALFGALDSRVSLFGDGSDRMFSSLADVRPGKGRKVGISGQAFGVGALEDEDDDIYGTDSMSKYDTVLKEESGDNLFGWTAPKEYRNKKGSTKELKYIGKVLEGFSITSQSSALKKVYPAPELPRDYKPVHYFRPVLSAANSAALQALLASSQCPPAEPKKDQLPSRHQLGSSQRREMLGEEALQGPAPSVLDLLSNKDRERIKDVTQTLEDQRLKAQKLAQEAMKNRFQAASADEAQNKRRDELLDRRLIPPNASEFRPFEGNPEKQKRYEIYTRKLHEGQKDALVTSLDSKMTEWEQHREQDEFMRSAMLYKPTNSSLSSRFTRGKQEDDSDKVDVPMDQEGDMDDKSAAVKMKMFGNLTRDHFEWHPDKLLCKRFNIPDPYPQSTLIGLPKVKRDKYSVFNFLTIPEPQPSTTCAAIPERAPEISDNKQKKSSRWDVSSTEKKTDPLSTFLSQARSQSEVKEEKEEGNEKRAPPTVSAATSSQSQVDQDAEVEEEETRPPIDLFKAIFADSSEKSSSSEEESDEEDSLLPREEIKDSRPETAPPSVLREPKVEVHQPIPPTATDGPDKMNAEEEFGPRLPPALPSATSRITCDSPSLSRDDSLKKSKQKRHKEKHRLKKEHKHKKEKKKKHKKQKHKSKHKKKKENNDSTDSEDSSTDLSDTEEAAKITPRELLKRLKNLPIPH